jgi:hypothetical protein
MRTPDQSNAAPDPKWVQYGTGHVCVRQCDDTQHLGDRRVLSQRGGKHIKRGPLTLGWRCPVCVTRREAVRVEVAA